MKDPVESRMCCIEGFLHATRTRVGSDDRMRRVANAQSTSQVLRSEQVDVSSHRQDFSLLVQVFTPGGGHTTRDDAQGRTLDTLQTFDRRRADVGSPDRGSIVERRGKIGFVAGNQSLL